MAKIGNHQLDLPIFGKKLVAELSVFRGEEFTQFTLTTTRAFVTLCKVRNQREISPKGKGTSKNPRAGLLPPVHAQPNFNTIFY